MKHRHDADVNISVSIPKEDLEGLIDKATDSILTIVTAITVSHVLRSTFARRQS